MGDPKTKPYRFVARNDPQDGTRSILAREASDGGQEVRLPYDPDRQHPPEELTDEEAVRVRQFAVLEEVSDKDAEAAKDAALAGGEVPKYTEDELKGKSPEELTEIANRWPNIRQPVPTRKNELVTAILEAQKGAEG
jgi:hypothetical protein